jgi:hypothetical protein
MNSMTMTRTLPTLVIAITLLAHAGALAQTAEPIGTVLVTRGGVEARAASGDVRVLTRRANLFDGDTLVTGSDGFVQVRMVDAAQLSLGPNTEFSFDAYQTDADASTPDSAVMSMLKGCFRTMAGSIGNESHDEYRIDTALASISLVAPASAGLIAGTLSAGVFYTGALSGGSKVVDTQGRSIALGLGADYDFSRTAAGAAPEGLVSKPPEFSSCMELASPPPGTTRLSAPSFAP